MLLFALTVPDKVDAGKVIAKKTVETTECPVAIPDNRGESATVAAPVIDPTTTTTSATASTSTALTTNLVDTNNNSNNSNNSANSIEEINNCSSSVSSSDSVTLPELSKALTISLILLGMLHYYILCSYILCLYTLYLSIQHVIYVIYFHVKFTSAHL